MSAHQDHVEWEGQFSSGKRRGVGQSEAQSLTCSHFTKEECSQPPTPVWEWTPGAESGGGGGGQVKALPCPVYHHCVVAQAHNAKSYVLYVRVC